MTPLKILEKMHELITRETDDELLFTTSKLDDVDTFYQFTELFGELKSALLAAPVVYQEPYGYLTAKSNVAAATDGKQIVTMAQEGEYQHALASRVQAPAPVAVEQEAFGSKQRIMRDIMTYLKDRDEAFGVAEADNNERQQSASDIFSFLHFPPAAPVAAPVQEHPDDLAVDRFATAMKSKLAQKRKDGRGGWDDKTQCSAEFLSQLLREYVEKGDPLDVGNLSMMLHQRGERINEAVAAPVQVKALEPDVNDDDLVAWENDDYLVTQTVELLRLSDKGEFSYPLGVTTYALLRGLAYNRTVDLQRIAELEKRAEPTAQPVGYVTETDINDARTLGMGRLLGATGKARIPVYTNPPSSQMYHALKSIENAGLKGFLTPQLCADIVTAALRAERDERKQATRLQEAACDEYAERTKAAEARVKELEETLKRQGEIAEACHAVSMQMTARAETAEAKIKESEADIKFEQSRRLSLKALAERLGGNWYDFCEMMGVQTDTNEAVAYNLKATIGKLERERDEARKALEPFAKVAASYDTTIGEHFIITVGITVGDLRRARSAAGEDI